MHDTPVRLLLIEDDVTTARIVASFLCEEYAIYIATNGHNGLQLLSEQPNLLLLDLGLPDMSGLDLICHIRASDQHHRLPILVMSADNSAQVIDQAFAAGANDYMVKPVISSALKSRIKLMLNAQAKHHLN